MGLFNKFPYTDLNSINLDYTLNKLNDLYERGEALYTQLQTWQAETTEDLASWKADVEAGLASWKTATEASIDNKIQLLTAAINAAFSDLETQLEAHIAEIETTAVNAASAASASATAAAGSASDAADSATAAAGSASDAEDTAESLSESLDQIATNTSDITDLKSAITHVEDLTITERQNTTHLELTWTSGYYMNSSGGLAENASYSYSNKIPVQQGDILTGYARFLTVFSDENTAVPSGFKQYIQTYTVPAGITYVVYSRETIYTSATIPRTRTSDVNISDTKIDRLTTETSGVVGLRATGDITGAETISLNTYNVRKGKSIAFYGKVTALGTLSIGCGTSGTNTSHFEIDDTNVKYYGVSTLFNTSAHSLTFEEYIFVLVDVDSENAIPTITIFTKSDMFTKTYSDYQWHGAIASVSATGNASTDLSDCELSFYANDFKKPIWYCGDSYMSFRDSARLPAHLYYAGVLKNFCSLGYSGADSLALETDLSKLLNASYYPKYIIWGIGMNNADSGAINSIWKSVTDRLIASCNSLGITLILCTIPNTPNVDNQYKNAYVRESGLRYIDYAAAVNTSLTGTTWVDGALSSDNVHPTQIGARLLASKLIADFPEICG